MAEQPALNRSIGVRLSGAPPLDIVGRFDLAPRGSAHTCALLFENSCDEKNGRAPDQGARPPSQGSPPRLPSCPRTHLARRPDCRSGEEGSIPFAGADVSTVPPTHPLRNPPRGHAPGAPDANRCALRGLAPLACAARTISPCPAGFAGFGLRNRLRLVRLQAGRPEELPVLTDPQASASEADRSWFDSKQGDWRSCRSHPSKPENRK